MPEGSVKGKAANRHFFGQELLVEEPNANHAARHPTPTKTASIHLMRGTLLISRRTCLRGLGVTLALPLMETMGWADQEKGSTYKPPVRLGFMYMPHGVIMERFWPTDPKTFLSDPTQILE